MKNWYKKNKTDKVWWLENKDEIGAHVFSFDKKTQFNLFADYPYKLMPEQKEIFDKENPYWVEFFADRQKQYAELAAAEKFAKEAEALSLKQKRGPFQLEIQSCGVLFPTHPRYFDGRFVLKIGSDKATVEVEKNGYTLNAIAVSEIENYILKVLAKLKTLSKKKKEYYEGGDSSSITLEYNGEKIETDCYIRDQKAFYKILDDVRDIVDKAIANGNAFQDKNSPDPVKEAEMLVKEAQENRRKQEKEYFEALAKKAERRKEIFNKLKTEKLHTFGSGNKPLPKGVDFEMGHYDYDPIVWEVFDMVGANDPEYKTYENHLKEKPIEQLTRDEIVEQFIFWKRGERFCDGVIADALESGDFLKLYEKMFGFDSEVKK